MSRRHVRWVEDAGRGSCEDAADPLDYAPSPSELAADAPITLTERNAFLASLDPTQRAEHIERLRAWHTPACGPDPLAPLFRRWNTDNTEETPR